jgi:tetratricopeptide (TPR) repeat protein
MIVKRAGQRIKPWGIRIGLMWGLWCVFGIAGMAQEGGANGEAKAGAGAGSGETVADLSRRLSEVQALQVRSRFVDALIKLDEAQQKFPDSADVYNLRGSILLAPGIRDYAKAEEAFRKAAALQKGSLAPIFNLAEVAFVKNDWPEAKKRLDGVLAEFTKLPMTVRHVVLFKVLLCQLKLGEIAEAEGTMKKHFTFMDDTPAYYFSKAAFAFQKEDTSTAKEWVEKAAVIFGDRNNSAYMDCLMEARWIPNIGLPPAAAKK